MQASLKMHTFGSTLRGSALQQQTRSSRMAVNATVLAATAATTKKATPAPATVKKTVAGTRSIKAGTTSKTVSGTKKVGGTTKTGTAKVGGTTQIKAIEVFSTEKQFRNKQADAKPAPKILSRVEQLRLLSKAEQAGLLSLAERSGLTLSGIEKSGLLSKAESLGLISAAADRNTPSLLYALSLLLLASGPGVVYLTPDDNSVLVALQVVVALVAVAGGSAAWGGAALLSSLQK